MRTEPNLRLDKYRINHDPRFTSPPGANWGAFSIQYHGAQLHVISGGTPDDPSDIAWGWEHVSVSLANRCPTWDEMCHVKRLFWRGDETVIEYHPPESRYVNDHPYCLHLWKPTAVEIPTPPLCLL